MSFSGRKAPWRVGKKQTSMKKHVAFLATGQDGVARSPAATGLPSGLDMEMRKSLAREQQHTYIAPRFPDLADEEH
jgi:hypothetical protein